MKIYFRTIELHNFGSYVDAKADLTDRGFCQVSGINNYKPDNAKSNGSGKSFLWSAICYAITGETIQGLKTNLKNINANDNNMSVKLLFSVDQDDYLIERGENKSKYLYITKNGNDISGKTFTESVSKLNSILPDISQNLISSIIILGQGLPNKFSSYSPSGRKELLEKLTKSDFMIEDIKTRVENRLDILKKQLREYQDSILIHNTELGVASKQYNKLIDEKEHLTKPDFDIIITNYTTQLTAAETKLSELSITLNNNEDESKRLANELLVLTEDKSKAKQTLLENYTTAISSDNKLASNLYAEISSISKEITRIKNIKDTCPTCGQKLVNVVKPSTEEFEKNLAVKNQEYAAVQQKLTERKQLKEQYDQTINDEFDGKIRGIRLEQNKLNIDKTNIKAAITAVQATITTCNTEIAKTNVDAANWDKYVQSIDIGLDKSANDIKTATDMIKIMSEAEADVTSHINIINKIQTLIKRDFRGYLLTNIINYINNKAKDYCDIVFGTRNLDVMIEGNALNITYCNKLLDNLSGGEKQRVDLILQFAIRNMLEVYLNVTSNIIVLDEITDFLDKKSCNAIMELIEKELSATESVFIVSHHVDELDIPMDSEIIVEKDETGNSRIL